VSKTPPKPDTKEPRRVLGRGLDALLPVTAGGPAGRGARRQPVPDRRGIERIHPRADQPRKRFDERALQELADSIREQGLIQPLIVRRREGRALGLRDHRRRAALARERSGPGLREVPVVVREATSDAAFELALVENLQRQDLDPVETATAYKRLLEDHGYTQEELAARVGKDRSTIANTLRLLQLPGDVLSPTSSPASSPRATPAPCSPPPSRRRSCASPGTPWRRAGRVRQAEAAARKPRRLEGPASPAKAPSAAEGAAAKSPNLRDLERRLEAALGMPVAIRAEGGTSGTVEIAFDSLDQLDSFLDKVLGR
jgi:ParB family chromosome partitioning protein